MAAGHLSEEFESFIAREFRSVEQLEILLLVRSAPQKAWEESEVLAVIRSSPLSVNERLTELCAAGYLARQNSPGAPEKNAAHDGPTDGHRPALPFTATYRYAPGTPALGQFVDEVAEAYKTRRVAVVEAIYRQPSPASELARAFKFERDKS